MDDYTEHSVIEYYIYELNFGKKYYDGCFLLHKNIVKLETIEDLYDLCCKMKTLKEK